MKSNGIDRDIPKFAVYNIFYNTRNSLHYKYDRSLHATDCVFEIVYLLYLLSKRVDVYEYLLAIVQ